MDILFVKAEPKDMNFIMALLRDNLGEVIRTSFKGNFDYKIYINNSIKEKYSLIILSDNIPCGFLWCSIKGSTIHVNTIVIEKEYQGKGIGKRVFGELEEIGRNTGMNFIQLGVQGSNKRALGFYKAIGFVMSGYLKQFDTYYMVKRIQ